jgi:hypothetical protein
MIHDTNADRFFSPFDNIDAGDTYVSYFYIDESSSPKIEEVRLLPSGDLLVSVSFWGTFGITVTVHKARYDEYDEEVRRSFRGMVDDERDSATTSSQETTSAVVSLILSADTHDVVSAELEYTGAGWGRSPADYKSRRMFSRQRYKYISIRVGFRDSSLRAKSMVAIGTAYGTRSWRRPESPNNPPVERQPAGTRD